MHCITTWSNRPPIFNPILYVSGKILSKLKVMFMAWWKIGIFSNQVDVTHINNRIWVIFFSIHHTYLQISGWSYQNWTSYADIKDKLEAQVGQKSLTWMRLIMICYIVPWWPSWLSDQIAFSNSESDVVWRFQDCKYGHHLGYWNWQQFWIISLRCLPSSFGSTWLTI